MGAPLVYEINTRAWLRELSEQAGTCITLADVPMADIRAWKDKGFTHIWLMGVWTTGHKSREVSQRSIRLDHLESETGLRLERSDIIGSPYAITHYEISERLGGLSALRQFRARLRERGLKLLTDFVPNHTGLDHPWVYEHPEYYVHCHNPIPESFAAETVRGPLWIAHGKDPYFPAWTDTAQLDYRNQDTRNAMIAVLQRIAGECDGVRCDMAMLLLNQVFVETWRKIPSTRSHSTEHFWKQCIEQVRSRHKEFLFLAEAYWDLEPHLIELGFDYAYNKRLLDSLMERRYTELQKRLYETSPRLLESYAHFLENHDEARICARLSADEHSAAAFLILCLPGMRLLHEGQLIGAKRRASVHLDKRLVESPEESIANLYNSLLMSLQASDVAQGKWRLLPVAEGVVAVLWETESGNTLAVVNLGSKTQTVTLPTGSWRKIYSSPAEVEASSRSVPLAQHQAILLRASS